MPFDIPNSWAWIRIKEILNIKTGASFKKEQASQQFGSDKIRVLRGGNILPFRLLLKSNDLYIPKDLVNDDILLQKNDLLTPSVTSLENIGKLCIVEEDLKNTTAGGFVFILRPYLNQAIFSKMCLLFISSPSFQLEMSEITKKSGQAFYNLSKERFFNLLLPIPPANEIGRIVNKFSSFLPLLSVYEKVETDLQKLEGNFEEKLKAAILQYAIEGKLVKQDPNDEPASKLLERIKAEKERLIKEGKIKRDKHDFEFVQSDDKNYYENNKDITKALPLEEIPNSWRWIRLDTLFSHNTGKALNSKNTTGINLEYITTSNLYWNYFILNDLKKMYFLSNELQKCTVKKGDLLVCEGGDIGRAAIWNLDKTICIQNHIHRLRPYIFISVEFYLLVLRLYKFSGYIGGKGIGIQGLSTNALGKLFLPLPPIEEQKRISTKVFAILKEYKIAL